MTPTDCSIIFQMLKIRLIDLAADWNRCRPNFVAYWLAFVNVVHNICFRLPLFDLAPLKFAEMIITLLSAQKPEHAKASQAVCQLRRFPGVY